jgi:hypothetical protein
MLMTPSSGHAESKPACRDETVMIIGVCGGSGPHDHGRNPPRF